jgi:hypothetical protein
MEQLQLEPLYKIIGIGSASGLIYKNDTLWIISDNSGFLYEYQIASKDLKRHALIENPSENVLKKDKQDYEAITNFGEDLYIFGSGSTVNRNSMVHLNASSKKVIGINNLNELYAAMQDLAKLKAEDFNLEGAIYDGKNWYLINRGNGIANRNIFFRITGKDLKDKFSILFSDYMLPELKGVRTSFTDAILVDSIIYFLATAEDTRSTYDDGEVLGSIIGGIDLKTMQITFTIKISDSQKFEGLTLFDQSKEKIEFLLCEDTDTGVLETYIYKLSLYLKLTQK